MPAAHGRSSSVFLNAYNVSAFLSSFDSTQTVDTAEVTTFGSTSKSFVTGLRDGTITLGGYFDGGAAALDEIMTLALNDSGITYGVDQFTTGDAASNYTVTGVSDAVTSITGFTNSIYFQNNAIQRSAYKTGSVELGKTYVIGAYIQMDDGNAPASSSNATSSLIDFTLIIRNNAPSDNTVKVERISGAIYKVTGIWSATSTAFNFANNGILKYTGQSSRGFRVSGMFLCEVTTTTAANPVLSICDDGALATGNRCLVANVIDTSYQITGSISEAVSISAEFQANGEGASGAYRGIVLAPLAVYSNGQNTTASDNSAATSNGLVANLHVLNAGGSTTVKVQHSTDNSTWTDLITFTTGAIQFSEHKVSTGTVHRYLRVNVTTDGLAQMLVTVARK